MTTRTHVTDVYKKFELKSKREGKYDQADFFRQLADKFQSNHVHYAPLKNDY